jgi:hypothetical protein
MILNCLAIRTFPPSTHDLSLNMLKKTAVLSGRLAEASTHTTTPPPFTSVKPLSPCHVLVAVGIGTVGDVPIRHTCGSRTRKLLLGTNLSPRCQAVLQTLVAVIGHELVSEVSSRSSAPSYRVHRQLSPNSTSIFYPHKTCY